MNTLQQFKLKFQAYIDSAIESGSEFLRDMWQQVLAERAARIKLMTDGYSGRHYGTRA